MPAARTITTDAKNVVSAMSGVASVRVDIGVMNDEQRAQLKKTLRGGAPERVIPFAQLQETSPASTRSPPARAAWASLP